MDHEILYDQSEGEKREIDHNDSLKFVWVEPKAVDIAGALASIGISPKGLSGWTRAELASKTYRTTMKNGPPWSSVRARITSRATSGDIIAAERIENIPRSLEHGLVKQGPRDIVTTLVFKEDRKGAGEHPWGSEGGSQTGNTDFLPVQHTPA